MISNPLREVFLEKRCIGKNSNKLKKGKEKRKKRKEKREKTGKITKGNKKVIWKDKKGGIGNKLNNLFHNLI